MENWKTYKLKDVCSKIGSGATPKGGKESYKSEGISLIRSQNVLDFNFSNDGLAFIDEKQAKQLSNVIVEENDILLNITGDSVARVCKVPRNILPARVNQHVAIIRTNEQKLSSDLLKYYLLNPAFKRFMLGIAAAGATRNALTKNMIEEFEIRVPESIKEQKAIAKILSSLDDKIELNRQMNATLEVMAQALFKAWFVDFEPVRANLENRPSESASPEITKLFPFEFENNIPKGWHKEKISQISSKIQYGFTQSSTTEDVGSKFLRITDIQGGKINWGQVPFCITNENEFKKYEIKKHDIFIARTGASTGENVYVVDCPKAVFASYLIRVQFESPMLSLYVGKFLRSEDYFNYVSSILSGSAQPNANAQKLTDIELMIPNKEVLRSYFDCVYAFEKQKSINDKSNQNLSEIRDSLLARLISGKIRVGEAENEIAQSV